MCTGIAKCGNNVMFPNLAHSRVARNGKMCAHCHFWQSLSAHTFAIPGNSRMCQIWKQLHCHFWQSLSTHLCHSWQLQNVPDLETLHCHFWQSLSTHLSHSWQLQNVPDLETVTLPPLAINLCHSWQLQNVPDLETDILPLLAITEHTRIFATIGHYKMSQIWTHFYIASFGTS